MKRLNEKFWDIYGHYAWDAVQLPVKQRMIRTIVSTLRERQAAPEESVLDTGCGTGNYSLALAEAGFNVTGIDFSTGMLSRARSKVPSDLAARLRFEKMDMDRPLLFPDATFDHIISMTSLWAVSQPRATLDEFCRVLKTGGTLIVMQVPKPTAGITKIIKMRLKHMQSRSPLAMALIAAKAVIERTSATKYWTQEELLALLVGCKQLKISYLDPGPPFFIVASKREPDAGHRTEAVQTASCQISASDSCDIIAQELCTSCGLCCNGTIFKRAYLEAEDSEASLANAGFASFQGPQKRYFLLPCAHLEGCRCRIYRSWRPRVCREFVCKVLKRLYAGEISGAEGLEIINAALRSLEELRRLLGFPADSGKSLQDMYAQWMDSCKEPDPAVTLKYVAFQHRLDRQFRVKRGSAEDGSESMEQA